MKEDGRYDLKTKNKYINFQIAIVMKEIKNLSAMVSLFQKENTGGALEKRKSVNIYKFRQTKLQTFFQWWLSQKKILWKSFIELSKKRFVNQMYLNTDLKRIR
eukprot:GHVP01023622.1.p1 GENE.GHVP01023622.1~~GHVP01023622.1.p1  ORF type:complete len:103 (+),score=18.50 GHVP01023622.1:15-323(+)